jgi:hypothetical protein
MPELNPVVTILEALVEQTRAIRDVKIQVEALKQMMFEHRPAFVPNFEERVKKIVEGGTLERLDGLMSSLETTVGKLRAG